MLSCLETIFMHDPVRFPTIGCSSLVEHQSLSHPYDSVLGKHGLVPSRCLPESGSSGSISPRSSWILLIFVTEEVPLILFIIP
jgi:hypothetical protein